MVKLAASRPTLLQKAE